MKQRPSSLYLMRLLLLSLLVLLIRSENALEDSSTPVEEGTCNNANDATCNASQEVPPPKDTPKGTLQDQNDLCPFWAQEGECTNNPDYMTLHCTKSCILHHYATLNNGTCSLYMAESSIPNSGWGMYTATPIAEGSYIPQPEILVNVLDYKHHLQLGSKMKKGLDVLPEGITRDEDKHCDFWAKSGECDANPNYMRMHCQESCYLLENPKKKGDDEHDAEENEEETEDVNWLPYHYLHFWDSASPEKTQEAIVVESLIPGVGSLANSHTGLWNTVMRRPTVDGGGLDRAKDVGAGAISPFHAVNHAASRDIPAGMEIFAEYGDNWFADREYKFGPLPLSRDFEQADELLDRFREIVETGDGMDSVGNAGSFTSNLLSLTHELSQTNKRLRMIIPSKRSEWKTIEDMGGTAMSTVPNVIRSPEWLEEHGTCLDNLIAAPSTIPSAGRGAFATRRMVYGQLIAPAPLIQVHRDHLKMYQEPKGRGRIVYSGDQLLRNYCFGHKDSSILFFSYGPVVNFINHHPDPSKVNAKLQWAGKDKVDTKLMDLSVDELLKKQTAGIMLEFVATKDIAAGEEIFIDYGIDWQEAWTSHILSWEPDEGAANYDYNLAALNEDSKIIRTKSEQGDEPYPSNAMTLCYLSPDIWEVEGRRLDFHQFPNKIDIREKVPCEIIERVGPSKRDNYTYIVSVTNQDRNEEKTVTGVSRRYIEITHRPYSRDYQLPNTFRHEIGIPEEIFPPHWMNLK